MKKFLKSFTFFCLIQLFFTEANSAVGEALEDFKVSLSKENLSALKGPSQFKEQANMLKHLNVPFEHISVSIPYLPRPPRSNPPKFSGFGQSIRLSTSSLPFREGNSYEFHFHFSKMGKSVDMKEIERFYLQQTPFLPGYDFAFFLKARSPELRKLSAGKAGCQKEYNVPQRSSHSIKSNPAIISLHLDLGSILYLEVGFSTKTSPDCVEILVHTNISDFFTQDLRQENQRLLQQHQALSSSFDDTRAELEDIKTHLKTLTLQAAAERSADSVTNTTVSSLRSSPQFSREESQNGTPTNDLEEPA